MKLKGKNINETLRGAFSRSSFINIKGKANMSFADLTNRTRNPSNDLL